jgi:hypothetical protein
LGLDATRVGLTAASCDEAIRCCTFFNAVAMQPLTELDAMQRL